jgi:hypothetical protein
VEAMRYGRALTAFDPFIVYGRRTFMETSWLPGLDENSIDALIEAMRTAVSPGCAIITHEFKGAPSRVPVEATAFGLRRDHVMVEIIAGVVNQADDEQRHRQWARGTRHSLEATAIPGGYPNLLTADDADRVAKSYGPNAERLIRAKRHYDPDNVFCSAIPLPGHEDAVSEVEEGDHVIAASNHTGGA